MLDRLRSAGHEPGAIVGPRGGGVEAFEAGAVFSGEAGKGGAHAPEGLHHGVPVRRASWMRAIVGAGSSWRQRATRWSQGDWRTVRVRLATAHQRRDRPGSAFDEAMDRSGRPKVWRP